MNALVFTTRLFTNNNLEYGQNSNSWNEECHIQQSK